MVSKVITRFKATLYLAASGHSWSESQKICKSFTVKKTSIERPLLLSGCDRLRAVPTSDFAFSYTSIKRPERIVGYKLGELCSDLITFKPTHVIIWKCTPQLVSLGMLHTRYGLHIKFLPCLVLTSGQPRFSAQLL